MRVLFRSIAGVVAALQAILALYLFLRGHNLPGGGFVGGLMLGAAGTLYLIGYESETMDRLLAKLPTIVCGGLTVMILSGVPALLFGYPFQQGLWVGSLWVPLVGKVSLGTVFLFDLGVFVSVAAAVLMITKELRGESIRL